MARKPGRRRWWPLLLVPPLVLLAWALVGMSVTFGPYGLSTGWYSTVTPNPFDMVDGKIEVYVQPRGGCAFWMPIVFWSTPVGGSEFYVSMDQGS